MNTRRFLVFVLLVIISCTPMIVKKNVQSVEESFDNDLPVIPETSFVVNQTYLDTLNRNKEIGLTQADFGREIQPTVIQTIEQTGSGFEIHYRIQIFVSSGVETLRAQKKMIEKKVDLPFYLTFEPPFYKLFVGDFLSLSDAKAMLSKVKKFGYTDAWIVTARSLN